MVVVTRDVVISPVPAGTVWEVESTIIDAYECCCWYTSSIMLVRVAFNSDTAPSSSYSVFREAIVMVDVKT